MGCSKCGTELIVGENWTEKREKKHYFICTKCSTKVTMDRRKTHQDEFRETLRRTSRIRRTKLRIEIIQLLGGQCTNPYGIHEKPFTDIRCLQIDHAIRGLHGHVYERKSKGQEMYMKEVLSEIKAGSKEYQLLCANCNWIKRYENNEITPKIDVIHQP
jgi:RNase P subunit RPR2